MKLLSGLLSYTATTNLTGGGCLTPEAQQMVTTTAVLSVGGAASAVLMTPSLNAAWTADVLAGALQSLGEAWDALFPGFRVFGKLAQIGQLSLVAQPGSVIPYAVVLRGRPPGVATGMTVPGLADALLATAAQYGNGPVYTYGPTGFAAVTRLRAFYNIDTAAPYAVEVSANPLATAPFAA